MPQSSSCSPYILNLPNELLLIISEHLDDNSLVHLAATCVRLNSLLLPGIYTSFGLEAPPPSGALQTLTGPTISGGKSLKQFSVMAITPSVKSIEVLDSVPSRTTLAFQDHLLAVRSLKYLAIRLSHLRHVRFNPYASVNSTDELSDWLESVAAFLNSAFRRGDCSISVYCQHDLGYDANPRPFLHSFPWVTAPVSPTAQPVERSGTQQHIERSAAPGVQSTERPGVTSLPFASKPALKSLEIHSSLLFHATFYKWTVHTLNTAPISTLSLDHIDLLHYDWTLTLPLLTLPALMSLTIGQCAIPVPDLTLFLARHSGIYTLDLSFHLAIGPLSPPIAEPILPQLGSLSGTPDYLLYFLAGKDGNGKTAYPNLHHVRVTSNDDSAHGLRQFARIVSCIEARRVVPLMELTGLLAVPAHLRQMPAAPSCVHGRRISCVEARRVVPLGGLTGRLDVPAHLRQMQDAP